MELGLAGRTAIVGGASAGIGLGVARVLRREGVNVVMFSNEHDELASRAKELDAVWVAGDLRDAGDLAQLVEATIAHFGGIDVLVLNGGGPAGGRAQDIDEDDVAEATNLILSPVIRLTRLSLPHLSASTQGRIVAIVSTSVFEPIDDLALSNTYRPAVLGWLKTLAREVGGGGVTVNAIAPGRIATRTFEEFYEHRSMDDDLAEIPLRRFGDPEEVGDLVAFLASRRAAYLTGTVIPIDGGLTRSLI